MLQRIQSLYLLLAAFFAALMLWMPLGLFFGDEQEYRLMAFGFQMVDNPDVPTLGSTYALAILTVLSSLLPLITIFLFNNRILQIRLCFVEIVLLFGVLVFTAFYTYHAWKTVQIFENHGMRFAVAAAFPVISIFFTYLAFRKIARDEALVRSVDRIR